MARILFFISLILFNTSVIADASDGEYLGYTLGDKFRVPSGAVGEYHITGAMIYAVDPKRQPHHIDSMSIYVSPKSSIIGSVFGEWYFSSARSAKSFADNYLAAPEEKISALEAQRTIINLRRPSIVGGYRRKTSFRRALAFAQEISCGYWTNSRSRLRGSK